MTISTTEPPTGNTRLLWLVFFASGFSGLIYESIWTLYLKLFLGHAAYAQTLVLGIFMGGMAVGAGLASRYSSRLRNPLRAYAIAEAAIGCCAFVFHSVFQTTTEWFYDSGLSLSLGTDSYTSAKWAIAILLILPQSILLGATFPLFAAGATRRGETGRIIAILYFANSLGGAISVLVSGFFLVPTFGLPGALAVAGIINLAIAGIVFLITPAHAASTEIQRTQTSPLTMTGWFLLGVSFLTGASSFIYEVGWIRMLSLVLGSATHSFELMLSAFITGLAFGGFWIRKRIDTAASPGTLLGIIQLVMGAAAIATLPLYNLSFDLIAWFVQTAPKTEGGYALFNLIRYGVAALVMFPAAFCAGMTLPLATHILYSQPGQHERAIGLIYGVNTLGAISGLSFAVISGLPLLGLNYLVASGAMIDVLLGAALILFFGGRAKWRTALVSTLVCGIGTVATAATFNPQKLVSGVFRSGNAKAEGKSIEIAHGRTATVSTENIDDVVIIRSNGKSDASATQGFPPHFHYRIDEVTQTLLAAIPLMVHPRPLSVANIGFGSGITGETVLGDPRVQRLDTIEIEPRMIELARRFKGRNEHLYTDPRSHIHIDDAKAYFAAAGKRYDLIISEPSNPWVSGVSGLFSKEFYQHVVRYLEPGGVFAQWLQVYEFHPDRAASVIKAVGEAFDDYLVVALNHGDLLILARTDGPVTLTHDQYPRLSAEIQGWLRRLDINHASDISMRVTGNKRLFSPWLAQKTDVPANSDFYPYIDAHADRDRFIGESIGIAGIATSAYLIPELMGMRPPLLPQEWLTVSQHYDARPTALHARLMAELLLSPLPPGLVPVSPQLLADWRDEASKLLQDCRHPPTGDTPFATAGILIKVLPYLSPIEGKAVISQLAQARCLSGLSDDQRPWGTLIGALLERNPQAIGLAASELLEHGQGATQVRARYLLGMAILGHLAAGQRESALNVWRKHGERALGGKPPSIELEILIAHALHKQ